MDDRTSERRLRHLADQLDTAITMLREVWIELARKEPEPEPQKPPQVRSEKDFRDYVPEDELAQLAAPPERKPDTGWVQPKVTKDED